MSERRVLIIEPDDGLARMVEDFLRSSRFGVVRARDVEQGRWLASLIRPQVVLVDSVPSDGVKEAQRFRDDGSVAKMPLVIMVPEELEDQNPDLVSSLRNSYDAFLYKPFADTELLRVVENFTGFGDSEEAEEALNNLLHEQRAEPELRNVVQELHRRKSNGNDEAKTEILEKRNSEIEEELATIKEESNRQAERITDLLDRISDLELDNSFALENAEAEEARLQNEIEALEKHIEKLEKAQGETLDLIESAQKTLKKHH